jgi:predicted dehydrogenase
MALKVVCAEGTIEFVSRGIDVGNRDESEVNVVVYKQGQNPEVVRIPERKDAYLAEIEYFVDCVLADRDPAIVTAQDARDSLALVLAAKQSVLEGKSIQV